MEYLITQYDLEQGALEIQYIEEYFGEFPRKKTATEIVRRLRDRTHLILIASGPAPDDPSMIVPVSYKVYTWIGGTRRDWRGQGHFRALTEQQEFWAIEHGFDEVVVKTKNKFYEMRGTLDHLRFEVMKYERDPLDNAESKVYLSKRLHPELIERHRSSRTVVQATI